MTELVPFSEAKAHLSELAERVEREHERVLVTRNGRPSFVLMSLDDLDALEETLDISRDHELVASLKRSQKEAADGKSLPLPSA
jgi:prevent-host-death family protein